MGRQHSTAGNGSDHTNIDIGIDTVRLLALPVQRHIRIAERTTPSNQKDIRSTPVHRLQPLA